MAKVKLSAAARRDLARIDDYGAEHFGDEAADAYTRGLNEAFSFLADVPFGAEARPDGEGVRCKVHRRHRILYRVGDETVFVQRILHYSRDVPRHLSDDR